MDPQRNLFKAPIQYHRSHYGHWGHLLNFSSLTIKEQNDKHWQDCSAFRPKISSESLFWLSRLKVLLFPRRAGSNEEQALSLHLSDARSKQQRADETLSGNVFMERLRSDRERLGCLFTICIQSSFVTVPCASFSETTETDTRRRFHFWPLCYTNS